MAEKEVEFIRWFFELNHKDSAIAGVKGASLAEMYNNKFPVPPGFVITAPALRYLIEKSGLYPNITRMLDEVDINDISALETTSKKIRSIIEDISMPKEMEDAIIEAYDVLDVDKRNLEKAGPGALDILRNSHESPFVAVRSSVATGGLDASFAGQQDTFLNIKGTNSLIEHIKKCLASHFTARAIHYRGKKGLQHSQSNIAVIVQKMIDAEKSGVIFSKNPLKDDENTIIEAAWGLGEGVVSGKISPDNYIINPNLKILATNVAEKKTALARNSAGKMEIVQLTPEKSKRQVLTEYEMKRLAQFSQKLEEHYNRSQNVEFAIANDGIYILQSGPITSKLKKEQREVSGNVLLSGTPASPGVVSGTVQIIHDSEDLSRIKRGNILVAKTITPDMVVAMQKSSAVITDEGGITSYGNILLREMEIPSVSGAKIATEKLKDGDLITVDGFTGRIIEGKGVEKIAKVKQIAQTETKIKAIINNPEYAEIAALSGMNEIGLIRMEEIISSSGKHPVWYIKNNKIEDYISSIYSVLKKISLPFKEIWTRTLSIKSDEHKNLEGAPIETEANPLLGDHGIRFSLRNQEILEAEFKAIKELADEFQEKKFGIMLSRVVSVEELKEAERIANYVGCPENVKIGIMIETPATALIIKELCNEKISFASFEINSITQHTLAVDKNNKNIQGVYNVMHPAVLSLIKNAIETCREYNVETSVCNALNNPEMIKFLLKEGIGSISVNADEADEVSNLISELENLNLGKETNLTKDLTKGLEKIKDIDYKSQVYEEDIILKALDESASSDEYNPSLKEDEEKESMPQLNEAIPVSSESLVDGKEEFMDLEQQEVQEEKPNILENQSEEVLQGEIQEVLEQSERDKEAMEELFGKQEGQDDKEKEKRKFLDIF